MTDTPSRRPEGRAQRTRTTAEERAALDEWAHQDGPVSGWYAAPSLLAILAERDAFERALREADRLLDALLNKVMSPSDRAVGGQATVVKHTIGIIRKALGDE